MHLYITLKIFFAFYLGSRSMFFSGFLALPRNVCACVCAKCLTSGCDTLCRQQGFWRSLVLKNWSQIEVTDDCLSLSPSFFFFIKRKIQFHGILVFVSSLFVCPIAHSPNWTSNFVVCIIRNDLISLDGVDGSVVSQIDRRFQKAF